MTALVVFAPPKCAPLGKSAGRENPRHGRPPKAGGTRLLSKDNKLAEGSGMGMWIVIGAIVLGVLAVALVVDLRDGGLRSRVDRRAAREDQLTYQNKATLSGAFLGSNNSGGG
jgi:hypothetical protein